MVLPFLLRKQLYSVEEEKGRISFLPGGNGVLPLSNGILRKAHNSNNNSEEDIERLPGLCFECPNCLMLKEMVIRKNPADAFIKLAPSSQIGKSKVKANQISLVILNILVLISLTSCSGAAGCFFFFSS